MPCYVQEAVWQQPRLCDFTTTSAVIFWVQLGGHGYSPDRPPKVVLELEDSWRDNLGEMSGLLCVGLETRVAEGLGRVEDVSWGIGCDHGRR